MKIKKGKNCLSLILLFSIISGLLSCNKECDNLKDELPPVEIKINRLEKSLFAFKSKADVLTLFKANPQVADKYFQRTRTGEDSSIVEFLYKFYTNPQLKAFYQETENKFGDLSDLKQDLESLFGHVKYYYPKYQVPPVATLVSGFQFDKDIHVSDSLIAISIDYFLGKEAKYRPPFFNYFLDRYEKPYIVPMIGLAVSSKFNEANPEDETMLSSMLYYGKAYYFLEQMMPCAHDSLITMYKGSQIKEIEENQNVIWSHFINQKLLYETKPKLIEKYVGESPKISEIGENCPGRIGRWLGWKIVKRYMEKNPEVTLQQLMAEKDAQKIFSLSKYKAS